MFSFAISQRSLERIGLSIAALVLVGFATVLSVLFFLQVKTIIFVFILIMCFFSLSIRKLYVRIVSDNLFLMIFCSILLAM